MKTTDQLKKTYKNIVAYCQYMGSNDAWLEQQLWHAYSKNLPNSIVNIKDTPTGKIYQYFEDYPATVVSGIKYYLNN